MIDAKIAVAFCGEIIIRAKGHGGRRMKRKAGERLFPSDNADIYIYFPLLNDAEGRKERLQRICSSMGSCINYREAANVNSMPVSPTIGA